MNSVIFTLIFAIFSGSLSIIWSIIFLLFTIFGVQLQKVGSDKLGIFNKKVKYAFTWTEEDTPDQWIIGYWFIGYVYSQQLGQHGGEQKMLYLLSTSTWYQNEVQGKAKEDKATKFTIYGRNGPYWHTQYEAMQMSPPCFQPYAGESISR